MRLALGIDRDRGCWRSWCTAAAALPAAAAPRLDPFASHTSRATELFEVADATLDERFRESELVTGPLAIRSYAGFALRTPGGDALGTLAVYGTQARALSRPNSAPACCCSPSKRWLAPKRRRG